MSVFSSKSGLAVALAMLCFGGRAADAQTAPVAYWTPGWPMGLGGDAASGESPNTYENFPSFDFRETRNGFSYARYNFGNGWFVGNQRGAMGFGGLSQNAFGNFNSLYTEGTQFGYSFKNAPVSIYGGFDTLKYNPGIGSPFAAFDSAYSANVGIEIRPTSNVSLSFGVGYAQQSGAGRIDSDINSPLLPGATPLAIGGRR